MSSEYVPLRKWMGESAKSGAGATPFTLASTSDGWRLPTNTKEDLRLQRVKSNESVHKEWWSRNQRRKQDLVQRRAQKYVDDVKTSRQVLDNRVKHLQSVGLSERSQMLDEVASQKKSEAKDKLFNDAQSRSLRSLNTEAEESRLRSQADQLASRRQIDLALIEIAEKQRERKRNQAQTAAAIRLQCQQHRRTSPFSAHTPRMAYFRFGAAGNLETAPPARSFREGSCGPSGSYSARLPQLASTL
eukprot:CAMPEP_0169240128 /NCGR_PEP_ID=MMETSP1016-20121227/31285_1 /TAXON_ID=342587 /ORGANISM="Karlodinium micrum, Strain CCMP2283" /LENGTH=244 /DNA_ID=CAMNT_0009320119 /DNA_START=35 /DNA_END=769 /DNA_ORIENTATION=+